MKVFTDRESAVGRVFNARKPSRVPAGVVFPSCVDEVVEAVRLARERGWQVSVRSGGHSWAAWSVRDGALLIDLSRLTELSYADGVAIASPAIKGGTELTPFLDGHGRTFTGGHCETVGLGGFLLQGGQGWNSRRWGWGCENVVGVDVVTAGGSLVHASAAENEDLFWAVRGAGPRFFGVVVRFHLRTYPAEPMFHDTRVFALDDLEPLLGWLHAVLPTLDVRMEPVLAATRVGRDETVLLLHTTMTGSLSLLEGCPCRALEAVSGPTTIASENVAMTIQNPEGYRYAADSQWTDAGAATLTPLLRDVYSSLPTEHSFSIWYGWAPTRELPDMAFSLERNVYLATYAIWSAAEDDERYRAWVHGHHSRLSSVGDGVYVGDSDFERRPDRYLSDAHASRLEAIRAVRDPDGLFVSA